MKAIISLSPSLLMSLLLNASADLNAQVVAVTLSLETNRIVVGSSTVLHAYAQIVPAYRANSDQIFSWYVDLLNANGAMARGEYNQLRKPFSDNDPNTSSTGKTDGVHRRAIYDTFINLSAAGRTNRVELFNVPVTGLAPGRISFRVQAGTSVNLSADFIVAPAGEGDPYLGGDYSAASIDLEVGSAPGPVGESVRLNIARTTPGQITLSFPVTAGWNYFVESSDRLGLGAIWQELPGGPHNSGTVIQTNNVPHQFYRVRTGAR
ncbi:MAG: hypothetical protein HY674_16815 [Chloroflexi bacterium]|nr:hypothetical protein [Chloroflexota bacterium]